MKEFLARRLLPRVLTVLRAILPRSNSAFVVGYPSTEGNAVETVRGLLRRYSGRVWWAQAPSRAYLDAIGISNDPRLRLVAKRSLLTIIRYARSEVVFFTHGVYGEPAATSRRPTVNLWHGAGMKFSAALFSQRTMRSKPSDVIAAPSVVWGLRCAAISGLQPSDALLVGYPRNDRLFRPASVGDLAALGITGPFVVWMPSYRNTSGHGTMPAINDAGSVEADQAIAEQFVKISDLIQSMGHQIVVKAHPLDATARSVPGTVLVDDLDLERAGIPLYSLLGASAALITDTSSCVVGLPSAGPANRLLLP